jgi:hypothetical protein
MKRDMLTCGTGRREFCGEDCYSVLAFTGVQGLGHRDILDWVCSVLHGNVFLGGGAWAASVSAGDYPHSSILLDTMRHRRHKLSRKG